MEVIRTRLLIHHLKIQYSTCWYLQIEREKLNTPVKEKQITWIKKYIYTPHDFYAIALILSCICKEPHCSTDS